MGAEYYWGGVAQTGMAGSVRAKQWARIPLAMLAINAVVDPEAGTDAAGRIAIPYSALAFFVSPQGSEHPYGESPLIPVRTVAFGTIPVEATLQLVQRRDDQNVPVPIAIDAKDGIPATGTGSFADPAVLDAQVGLRVRSLKVDGVDLRLRSTCAPRTWARLQLTSKYWEGPGTNGTEQMEAFDTDHSFMGGPGGTLTGTLDIPAFANCRTAAGDDVSRILTATIAGPGNPVTARLGIAVCFTTGPDWMIRPPGPGDTTPEKANCLGDGRVQHPIPANPKIVTVPDPLPFPNHAP
ncbi:hypothetical protein EFK50_02300 [Nocardioides marmoriginsengisoli]|uniref:Uncharacterized protein n=2 Tax=Nocardioides marmoriginsengisoli TaxID=661483 RepID=A0A3N0CN06_9ACTN|nr:hypothetical protein EFK50_02300 [Nocardioides marmoriginsengisoli]